MTFTYDFETKDGLVAVRARGAQTSVDQCIGYANDIPNICKREECRRVLLDERHLTVQIGVLGDYA